MISTHTLLLDQLVVRGDNNIVSDMGGEKVMLSIENGKYYNLGVMGGQIWDLVDEPVTIASVVDSLIQEFDVEKAQCEEQVLLFLSHLLEERLLQIIE
ncbi:lasso peptide biosynthesis PqqD family chaperone [Paenibacillus alkaliterrae]|uniref:lasso peptide biosynthesis PqqD family chaperone n=1 Tax=Paenibacillus alkaliterrae TaxID=320909 RepID=UPI0038B31467